MRHGVDSLSCDGLDLDDGKFLAVAALALHALALLLFEDDHLVTALVLQHFGGNRGSGQGGGADLEALAFARGEDVLDLDDFPGRGVRITVNCWPWVLIVAFMNKTAK